MARPHRAHRERHGVPPPHAARRGARRERWAAGRRVRTRRAVLERPRPVALRRDAPERRSVGHAPADPVGDAGRVHPAAERGPGLDARAGMGHAARATGLDLERRHQALAQCVRPHRIHRHLAVARSRPGPVHYSAHQSRPPHARQPGDPAGAPARGRPGRRGPHPSGAMTLSFADWLIIVVYFALSAAIGLYYTGRAGRSLADYFLSGRSMPWWLAGTSMVATTFAADTPLVVTGLVVKYGVAGNWLWWNMALSGLLTVFFFARLWRRAGVLTDVELVELRYGGRPAAVLRGARALYLALPINLIIMGWVTKAMADILQITLGISGWRVAALLFLITAGYSILSGLWGVVVTDFFQFIVAMGGSITLAVLAVNRIGGLDRLGELASAHYGGRQAALGILPPLHGGWLPLSSLLVFLAVQWWASWYPGAEPGGGGYIAQRIMSTRDERHGLLATLWFNIAHYALRPWPWILVGLFAAVTYPDLTAPGTD